MSHLVDAIGSIHQKSEVGVTCMCFLPLLGPTVLYTPKSLKQIAFARNIAMFRILLIKK